VGLVEGASDASSSLVKSYSGYYSDRSGKRTPIMYLGYALTSLLIPAIGLVTSWVEVLALRMGAWMGRGARGPPRDALLVDSIPPGTEGKAFGLERTFDTLGAIAGPAIALLLIPYLPLSQILFVSLVPGVVCMGCVVFLVKDVRNRGRRGGSGNEGRGVSFIGSIMSLPKDFRTFLLSVGLFGVANFSNVIFTLRAEQVLLPSLGALSASEFAVSLYLVLNVVYALGSLPAGFLADRTSKRNLLAMGYLVFALACVASVFETPDITILLVIFILAGLQTAIVDTVERAYASDLIGDQSLKGTGFGVMQTVNGVGDFVSSTMIGVLWTLLSPAAGFALVASIAVLSSALLLIMVKR
jgi:MFS family permease